MFDDDSVNAAANDLDPGALRLALIITLAGLGVLVLVFA